MKIFTAEQIRRWDSFTIENEPISSIDLMERAAYRASYWLMSKFDKDNRITIVCGSGNNGGDGLVIARYLNRYGYKVRVVKLMFAERGSDDFEHNLKRLKMLDVPIADFSEIKEQVLAESSELIIDALFGSGLSRRPAGEALELIQKINLHNGIKVSIDIPSGMYCCYNTQEDIQHSVWADYTLSFQTAKLAFLLPTSGPAAGEFAIIDIGLHEEYVRNEPSKLVCIEDKNVINRLIARERFSHKGTYGHALIIGGSKTKTGAAIISATACLKAGAGLVSVYSSHNGILAVQAYAPELMCVQNSGEEHIVDDHLDGEWTIGIGPGLGTHKDTIEFVERLFSKHSKPMVIDADALNIISAQKALLSEIPKGSILTPHPKEFERLVGKWKDEKGKLDKLRALSQKTDAIVILKGAYSIVCTPDGKMYFNATGNYNMATAGSGDVLTGILLSLLCQGYNTEDAAIIGAYLHGTAGDIAASGDKRISALEIANAVPQAIQKFEQA